MLKEHWKVIECDDGYIAVVSEGDVICVPDTNHEPGDAADAIRFRAIAAVPDMLAALEVCPLPSTMGNVETHYQQFYDWYKTYLEPAMAKSRGVQ